MKTIILLIALLGVCSATHIKYIQYGANITCNVDPYHTLYYTEDYETCPDVWDCHEAAEVWGSSDKQYCVDELPSGPAADECWLINYTTTNCTGNVRTIDVYYKGCRGYPLYRSYSVSNTATNLTFSYCTDHTCSTDCTSSTRPYTCVTGTGSASTTAICG